MYAGTQGNFITRDANFQNPLQAFLLLVRFTTGEDWNGTMHDCMVEPPNCPPEYNMETGQIYDTCGSPYAPIYFISFLIITVFVVMNGVVMNVYTN